MRFDDWLRRTSKRSPEFCDRCAALLVPVESSHYGKHAAKVSEALAGHNRLIRRAWRSSCVQEGGEDLYQCADCHAWWSHVFWSCVAQESLARTDVASVEAWVQKEPRGEVVQNNG